MVKEWNNKEFGYGAPIRDNKVQNSALKQDTSGILGWKISIVFNLEAHCT